MKKKDLLFAGTLLLGICISGCSQKSGGSVDPASTPQVTTTEKAVVTQAAVVTENAMASPEATEEAMQTLQVFYGDSNAEFIVHKDVEVSAINEKEIEEQLKKADILSDTVTLNNITVSKKKGTVKLKADFSKELQQQVYNSGEAGERILIGSIVNTILKAYGGDRVTLLADGKTLEGNQQTYNKPLKYFEAGVKTMIPGSYKVEGDEQECELAFVYNELGYAMGYDYENFSYEYDQDAKVASYTFKEQGDKEGEQVYISITMQDMTKKDVIEGLKLQAKGKVKESQEKIGADKEKVSVVTDTTKNNRTKYYILEHNNKVYMIERVCYIDAEEGWGAVLDCMLETFRFVD